jgi:hypothetical protein
MGKGYFTPPKSKTGEPISMKLEMRCSIRGMTIIYRFWSFCDLRFRGVDPLYPTVSFLFYAPQHYMCGAHSARRVLAIAILSVRPSVRHIPVPNRAEMR